VTGHDPADTYRGLRVFVDELARCGVRHAVTSPGSRSTPLVLTLAREERLAARSIIDERSAAFYALGVAKASGRPVALACTSGTAAANYAPAVIEAHEARVPLLVLTADRPPELRDVGAGQTIDQVKLFGSAAKWFLEVDEHPATPARLRWLRQLACRAVWTALDGRPGPVHLNFSLREPLTLPGGEPDVPAADGGRSDGRPWVSFEPPASPPSQALLDRLRSALDRREQRALIVAGRTERDPRLGPALSALAERAGVPLLAEPLSGARRGPAAIAHYDALLRDDTWAAAHVPELVLRVGDLPTSKPLRQWLGGLGERTIQVSLDPEAGWQDPAGAVGAIARADARALAEALRGVLPRKPKDTRWLDAWRAADRAATAAIVEVLAPAGLSEPRVAAELAAWLPEEATLFVASSMPVRDLETFAPVRDRPPRVLANRGANGIDGTVSTAAGVGAASAGPVVLLTGDVALAHDVGGLLCAQSLTIVLVHNDGGGIFSFLPVSEEGEAFTEHVATPHGLDFAHAAALYSCDYELVRDVERLRAAVAAGLGAGGTRIVAVKTDREANVALHRAVWDAVRGRLAG
jgi:2-succinyl-5-enolpyruvyl-6-hydroxy-3-cyclohexene-1-carboxylate synthase